MENEIDINKSLSTADLFGLFRIQLAKDFAGAGLTNAFPDDIPSDFFSLKQLLVDVLSRHRSAIAGLLYRVDISESQIKKASESSDQDFESLLAELIIKRVLQKVIIRKNYSAK